MSLPKRIALPLTLSSIFLSQGCNVISSISESPYSAYDREKGYNPDHCYSCGPYTLESLLKKEGIEKSKKDISKEILEREPFGNTLRLILGTVNTFGGGITWPWEMEKTLQRELGNKYKITKLKRENIPEYIINNPDAKGIILLGNKSNPFDHHWESMPYPPQFNIFKFYPKGTGLETFYLIEKSPPTK